MSSKLLSRLHRELASAKPMEYTRSGLGLTQYVNDEVGFAGGMRTGKPGSDGCARLKYAMYDLGGKEPQMIGNAELNIWIDNPHLIEGVVKIELNPKFRNAGLGRKLVEALVATSKDGLHVYDIKKSAIAFWKKLGAEIEKDKSPKSTVGGQFNGFIPKH